MLELDILLVETSLRITLCLIQDNRPTLLASTNPSLHGAPLYTTFTMMVCTCNSSSDCGFQ